jgi:hypothetical protein
MIIAKRKAEVPCHAFSNNFSSSHFSLGLLAIVADAVVQFLLLSATNSLKLQC